MHLLKSISNKQPMASNPFAINNSLGESPNPLLSVRKTLFLDQLVRAQPFWKGRVCKKTLNLFFLLQFQLISERQPRTRVGVI